jgi:glycosyltransferase involved in cell wall biosynthesis
MLVHAAISCVAASFGPFDIVHFHACGPSLFAGLPRLLGKKTLATLHGTDWMAPKWSRATSLGLRLGEWSACRFASKAICVSLASQNDLRRRLGVEVECILNGVLAESHRPLREASARFGVASNQYITFVGRLTGTKNVHHLIEAFRETRTDMKLVIIGGDTADAPYVRHLLALAAGDDRIIFTGMLHGELLAELCSNAYLFCLPSSHEGLSVALLEALAYGVPVLVSDIEANTEVIGGKDNGCGLTFKVGSVESLRTRLVEASSAPAMLAAFREGGRALVSERYSWDRAAADLGRVYADLVWGARPTVEPVRRSI